MPVIQVFIPQKTNGNTTNLFLYKHKLHVLSRKINYKNLMKALWQQIFVIALLISLSRHLFILKIYLKMHAKMDNLVSNIAIK